MGNWVRLLFVLIGFSAFSQENSIQDIAEKPKDSLEINLDIPSRYIWRGQAYGGDYIAFQPTVSYTFSDKLRLEVWATSNFQKQYETPMGNSKGYQEFDFSISYNFLDYFTVKVADYYWPAVERGIDTTNNYFDYRSSGVKTVDLSLGFETSDIHKEYKFEALVSTFIAGSDYRKNHNGQLRQNFTTYTEMGYTRKKMFKKGELLKNLECKALIGAVLNNNAMYYEAGDYNKISVINSGIQVSDWIGLSEHFTLLFAVNYNHNAATANVGANEKDFFVAQISLNYKPHTN